MTAPPRELQARRLDELTDFVIRLASGQLDARLAPSQAADELDAIVVGLNMLAEELQGLTYDLEKRVEQRTQQLAAAHQELERLALYDPLTGLANRTLLAERMGRAMAETDPAGFPPTVLLLDLDGFKAVNDGFGHAVGDALLVVVAQRLCSVVRQGDTVARLGGDEFAIVLQDAGHEQALEIADRICAALAAPMSVGGQVCWVSASVGVRFAVHGEPADTFLRDADTAMYDAKGRAPGGVSVFEPAMHQEALTRNRLADELRTALAERQFFVLYQPIVELASGRVAGVESLVRWRHPERGILAPDAFITVAEDTGIVSAIDQWVLDESAAQVRRWRDQVLGAAPFGVHVNISPVELRSPHFATTVLESIARHRLDAADITIEITERGLLGEDAATQQSMETLRTAGVGVAIDDFGTGTSSLGYVRRSFVDTIKIDRSLVRGLDVVPQQHRVAAAILAVVDAFGLEAVAEGVESDGEAERLRALGARFGQGYHWSVPRTGEQVTSLLRGESPG